MGILVKLLQFLKQYLKTQSICDQIVEAEMQPQSFIVKPRRSYFEQRPPIGCEHLVRHLAPSSFKVVGNLTWAATARIRYRDFIRGHAFEYLLSPVGQHNCAQHIVPLDQRTPRLNETS